jgi:preprotein translocase subunit SecG
MAEPEPGKPGKPGEAGHLGTGGAGGAGGQGGTGQVTGGSGGTGGPGGSGGSGRRERLGSYWTERGIIPRWQYMLVYVFITMVMILGFASTRHQAQRTDKVVKQNQLIAKRADILARQQIQSRKDSIRETCEQQNQRHDDLLKLLRKIAPKVAQPLADTGWPVFDCSQRVRDLVG